MFQRQVSNMLQQRKINYRFYVTIIQARPKNIEIDYFGWKIGCLDSGPVLGYRVL